VRFDLEVTIARPVEDVFAYVSDVAHLPEWQESAVAASWIESGKRFRERRSFLGRTAQLELEVTACEPNRRVDVKSARGPVRFEIRHACERSDGCSLLRVSAEAAVGGALRFAAGMARKQAEREFRSDLARLNHLLVSHGSDPIVSDPALRSSTARRGKSL
jgi:uncharacterized membrane protein